MKRALSPLAIVGKEAVEYLLKGAKYKRVDGDGYKLFEKRGRFKDARRDFNAVKPTNKKMKKKNQSDNTVITGTVGDRRIQLRYNKISFGHKEFPIVLINSPGEQPIKIIYKN